MATKLKNTKPIEKLIQIGDSTHHQLQSMCPVSLRVMNTMVSSPVKPMPPDVLEATSDLDIAYPSSAIGITTPRYLPLSR